MKTLNEISNSISRQIGAIAKRISADYTVITCPERIFVDDYLEQRNEDNDLTEDMIPYLGDDIPNRTRYSKTIFFVIKVGGGQRNMAVSNSDITIKVLSEEDDFVMAREILEAYVAEYNFQYDESEGIAQAYFNPEILNTMDEVYTGFRALLSVRGFVRIPADGSLFVNEIDVIFSDDEQNEVTYKVPFLNMHRSYSAQPDPQAFAGFGGLTKALNRQCTEVITFSTYLKYYGDDTNVACDAFTLAMIRASAKMNRKFRIKLSFQNGLSLTDDWFVLTGADYAQQLADLDMWNLSFTSAKEAEDD